jgi:septal ring factor EnvC (AmiA/AmiB activator)
MNGRYNEVMMRSGSRSLGVLVLGVVAGCLLIFSGSSSLEAQDQEARIDEFERKARDITREIEKGKAKIQEFSDRETDIILKLNQVDQALNRSRKRIARLSHEIDGLEKKIGETAAASDELVAQIKVKEAYVARRLAALYKLNWLGKFHVLASAESLQDLLQRKQAIERILTYDEEVIGELIDNRLRLDTVRSSLETHRNEKRQRADAYQKQIKQMAVERTQRSGLLVRVRKEKSVQEAAIDSLKQAARDLDEKIKNLGMRSTLAPSEEHRTVKPFQAFKGLLKMPVKGRIVSLFGKFKNTRYDVLNFRSGIEIQTERGEPITAVYSGKILYADWFKGYGNMLIIDHGDNYYTVYAHIEEAFKSTGDAVEAGEVIATVGDTGSITGPKLYFEVRHHGKPLDPMQWLETASS